MIKGKNLVQVPLVYTTFWVQIHNLWLGLMLKGMARQFGNFIRQFLEYETALIAKGVRKFMRIKVWFDVWLPLKRKKRIINRKDNSTYAHFNMNNNLYSIFLWKTRYGKSFYPVHLTLGSKEAVFGWDISLRALSRRVMTVAGKWLREELLDEGKTRMD